MRLMINWLLGLFDQTFALGKPTYVPSQLEPVDEEGYIIDPTTVYGEYNSGSQKKRKMVFEKKGRGMSPFHLVTEV